MSELFPSVRLPRWMWVAAALVLIFSQSLLAQTDFSGDWVLAPSQSNLGSPMIGEYVGIPLNAEAIRRAEIWDAAVQSLPERQCRPPPGMQVKRSPSSLRISKQVDDASNRIASFEVAWPRLGRVPIHLDGRAHPPTHAAHTWGGFSTGTWEGNRLKVRTTHLKEDYYRSNGVPQSDQAVLSEYLIRRRFRNEDYLTWVVIAYDPIYLTEPIVRSTEYRLAVHDPVNGAPCAVLTDVTQPSTYVPHRLPGTNTQLHEFADTYGLPRDIRLDGAQTMYPQYRTQLAAEQERDRVAERR